MIILINISLNIENIKYAKNNYIYYALYDKVIKSKF